MLVQMGYVVLFSSAFPLAGLCALANNLLEIRSDAFKLAHVHQRPFGQRVANIGTWQNALGVLGLAAVIVNCALIGLSGQVSRLWPGLTQTQTVVLIVALEVKINCFRRSRKFPAGKLPNFSFRYWLAHNAGLAISFEVHPSWASGMAGSGNRSSGTLSEGNAVQRTIAAGDAAITPIFDLFVARTKHSRYVRQERTHQQVGERAGMSTVFISVKLLNYSLATTTKTFSSAWHRTVPKSLTNRTATFSHTSITECRAAVRIMRTAHTT